MKVALDPYMHRRLPLREVVHLAAELDYAYIELSPRSDFLPFFVHPRADSDRITELKKALRETGVGLASLLPLYRWASPIQEERQAALRYWKRAIQVAVELECMTMNSEFSGRPDNQMGSEAAFWKSMDELLPIFEGEGITLHLEPHPYDFIGSPARVHQHLNIGEGEINWEAFFQTLQELSFDGIVTSCVFAWEERAVASSKFMREQVRRYLNV